LDSALFSPEVLLPFLQRRFVSGTNVKDDQGKQKLRSYAVR
jgi:hypothetical protein